MGSPGFGRVKIGFHQSSLEGHNQDPHRTPSPSHQVTDNLDKYGIGSATDVSELKDHDFIHLETLGLKPFQLNKVKRWCEAAGRSS
jgi:hypothetical protein